MSGPRKAVASPPDSSLHFKVYSAANVHVAACLLVIDAVRLVLMYGHGASIRYRSNKLWREGEEQLRSAGAEEIAHVVERRFRTLGANATRSNPHGYPDGSPQATGEADDDRALVEALAETERQEEARWSAP